EAAQRVAVRKQRAPPRFFLYPLLLFDAAGDGVCVFEHDDGRLINRILSRPYDGERGTRRRVRPGRGFEYRLTEEEEEDSGGARSRIHGTAVCTIGASINESRHNAATSLNRFAFSDNV